MRGQSPAVTETSCHVSPAVRRRRLRPLSPSTNDDGSTPAVATADWGHLGRRARCYSVDDLSGWLATMRRVGAGWRDAFVFFGHEAKGTGPALAPRLLARLAA